MSYLTQPATAMFEYKEADSDFDSNIVKDFRMINASGGTRVVFKDGRGETVTVLAADYSRINNVAINVTEIVSTTDCTSLYCWM